MGLQLKTWNINPNTFPLAGIELQEVLATETVSWSLASYLLVSTKFLHSWSLGAN